VTLSLPPDTDTPGFAEEQKSKPEETKIISEAAGLFSADAVAQKMLNDALVGFLITYNLKIFILLILLLGGQFLQHHWL